MLSPRQVQTFPIVQSAEKGDAAERVSAEAAASTLYYTRGVLPVSQVSCGSGFTACVLKDTGEPSAAQRMESYDFIANSIFLYMSAGEVCTWGTWQHGRLGRSVPILEAARGRRSLFRRGALGEDGKRRYARYQLRPILVPGVRDAVAVACGEAHALCLTKEGHVLSWGQNSR